MRKGTNDGESQGIMDKIDEIDEKDVAEGSARDYLCR